MTKSELIALINLQGKCSYNDQNKQEFRRLGMKLARELRKELGLTESADVRYNAGGIAVSGDVTLHADNFYLQFNADGISSGLGIMYRHCNGRKDYGAGTGTPNHWYRWNYLQTFGVIGLVRTLASFQTVRCVAKNMQCVAHVALSPFDPELEKRS
jgi:hypothetical protein